jgi:TRAP-type mannitol/chloroaromatic compound transport system permease small subunit
VLLMRLLESIIRFVDSVNEKLGIFASWITTLMVLVVCYDVVTRYFLKRSSVAVQELEWHLFAVVFLIGAAYTLKHDRHVRVDVLYMKFKPKIKAWVNLLGSLIFLIPVCLIGIWSSMNFVVSSFLIGEGSPDPGGLPARCVLKAVIPLSFFLLLLQGLSLSISSIMEILGKEAGVAGANE